VDSRGVYGPLEWSVAARPLPGESVSGDAFAVVPNGDRAVMAVIDGLGHGPDAAAPARLAAETVRDNPGEPLDALLTLCHRVLEGSRGAAITVSSFDLAAGSLTWVGVGNVEACIVRTDAAGTKVTDAVMLAGGVIGFRLPVLRPRTVELRQGDVVLMATDGVDLRLQNDFHVGKRAAMTAESILERGARPSDDALVLLARYQGWKS
jgi:negative regulator of sigma-B (phosphoserine phosphatase)